MDIQHGHDQDDFKIKGAASRQDVENRQSRDTCTICQQPITDRAVAVPCNHLTFDFVCLATWLQEQPRCPLCNTTVRSVEYDWRAPDDHKTYGVGSPRSVRRRADDGLSAHYHRWSVSERDIATSSNSYIDPSRQRSLYSNDPALERRKHIYRHRLYSLHVGANSISGHRDFTPANFADSEELQRRARAFLRRELRVFGFLDPETAPRGRNHDWLMEHIVAMARVFELKGADGRAENLLTEVLGRVNARLLLHELVARLRSPCASLEEWDRIVQYADGDRTGKEA